MLLLLLSLWMCCTTAYSSPLNWFRVPPSWPSTQAGDFRGCFPTHIPMCLVVGSSSLLKQRPLAPYVEGQEVWVLRNGRVSFGSRPNVTRGWVDRVPGFTVRPPREPVLVAPKAANPVIQSLVDGIDKDELRKSVDKLAAFHTRNSFSKDSVEAAEWLKSQLVALGCTNTVLKSFKTGYSPNVVCTLESQNKSVVIAGAHYDSRARSVSSSTQRAPGADDNASGVAALLEIFRVIVERKITFANTIMFAFFSGEEQGLYGSEALAAEMRNKAAAMVNADMIGYERKKSNTVYFDRDRVTKSVQDLGRELVSIYMPGIKTDVAVGCCSDGENFYNQGIPTGSVFEARDVENPNYHEGSDLPDTLSYDHLRHNTQAIGALFATLANAK